MFFDDSDILERAQKYCDDHSINLIIAPYPGKGLEGYVYRTSSPSAIKVHRQAKNFQRELAAYRRLNALKIESIQEFRIPQLRDHDSKLLILEMDIVAPPCIVDFGGAYLDALPPHAIPTPEMIDEKKEQFGDNWPKVMSIITELDNRYKIFLSDVHPGNIQFGS